MSLRDLLAVFKIEVDDKELKAGDEKVESFKEKLGKVATLIAEAFAVDQIKEFVEGQIEAGDQLRVMSERLGTTAAELQSMQLAADLADVQVESLTTGLRFLNRNLAEATKAGSEGARLFTSLGIAVKDGSGQTRTSSDVLGELADKLAEMPDAAKKTEIAMRLLGRGGAELIPLLNKGSAAFDDARKSVIDLGGGLSDEFIAKADETGESTKKLTFAMNGLESLLAEALFPVVKTVAEWLTNITAAASKFERQTGALSTAVQFFGAIAAVKALGSLKDLATVMGILKPSVIETVQAFLDFAAPLVAIALLYLAFDELVNLLKGNDTIIGRMLGPDKKKFVDDLRGAINDLTSAFSDDTNQVEAAGGVWKIFAEAVVDVAQALAYVVESMAWIVDKGALVLDVIKATQGGGGPGTDEAAGRAWEAAKARWADVGTGKHDNLNALHDRRNADATASQKKDDDDADQKRQWTTAVRERDETGYKSPSLRAGLEAFFATHQNPYVTVPAGGTASAPDAAQPTNITTTNNIKVDVRTSSDQPKAVGDATGQGVANAQQRAHDKTLARFNRP